MDLDRLYKPREASPLLGMCTKEVQILCAKRAIRHEMRKSPGGRIQYLIPESAIAEYRQQRTVEARRRDLRRVS